MSGVTAVIHDGKRQFESDHAGIFHADVVFPQKERNLGLNQPQDVFVQKLIAIISIGLGVVIPSVMEEQEQNLAYFSFVLFKSNIISGLNEADSGFL